MTHHTRGVSGSMSATGSASPGRGREAERIDQPDLPSYTREPRPWEFWISHRQGPFMIHSKEGCDPKAMGCHNAYDNLIEQGFMPCPKCGKE